MFKKSNGDILLVVPKSMRTQLIKKVHDQGHFSIAKTEALLLKDYFMPNAKARIEKVVRNYVSCILSERKQGK